ncbi:hypothetical protein K437DRAFT_256449 [Tilletiaria anomala UBC 951]|uniref:Uncharacterized protein n=1 Tax=Tilletiaria anomala (strain ATCC 24038 / CBS 436.72 / UBC 951) TaxID=1037660 RepID=A0A066VZK7_TILAU|nr:uncharacterized protein K437DRAFT_256449 [Tilletiaria anomala UBC 951]KDN45728.1 hypothetical protein K437DRAFT_256449 [Tilletiaria anomala UBC 951]
MTTKTTTRSDECTPLVLVSNVQETTLAGNLVGVARTEERDEATQIRAESTTAKLTTSSRVIAPDLARGILMLLMAGHWSVCPPGSACLGCQKMEYVRCSTLGQC